MNEQNPPGVPMERETASATPESIPPPPGSQKRKPLQILSEQECAAKLSQLPGLVAMGFLKPPQANATRGALKDLLGYHQSTRQRSESSVSTDDVLLAVRQHPHLLNLLEPLLTDDQLKEIVESMNQADE